MRPIQPEVNQKGEEKPHFFAKRVWFVVSIIPCELYREAEVGTSKIKG